eukprot:1146848-Pelagomonas_calceolata.AAC.1
MEVLPATMELNLDTHAATKLALKFHAHFVKYAYKLASTRRALEKVSQLSSPRGYTAPQP